MTNSIRCIECLKSCENFLILLICVAGLNVVLATWLFHTIMRSVYLANQELFHRTKRVIVMWKNTETLLRTFLLTVVKSENNLSYFPTREYFDISSLNGAVGDQSLYLMHFNVRSIQKNVNKLANLLTQLKALPDVLAITETKLKPDQEHTNINLESYTFIHSNSEKNTLEEWVFT